MISPAPFLCFHLQTPAHSSTRTPAVTHAPHDSRAAFKGPFTHSALFRFPSDDRLCASADIRYTRVLTVPVVARTYRPAKTQEHAAESRPPTTRVRDPPGVALGHFLGPRKSSLPRDGPRARRRASMRSDRTGGASGERGVVVRAAGARTLALPLGRRALARAVGVGALGGGRARAARGAARGGELARGGGGWRAALHASRWCRSLPPVRRARPAQRHGHARWPVWEHQLADRRTCGKVRDRLLLRCCCGDGDRSRRARSARRRRRQHHRRRPPEDRHGDDLPCLPAGGGARPGHARGSRCPPIKPPSLTSPPPPQLLDELGVRRAVEALFGAGHFETREIGTRLTVPVFMAHGAAPRGGADAPRDSVGSAVRTDLHCEPIGNAMLMLAGSKRCGRVGPIAHRSTRGGGVHGARPGDDVRPAWQVDACAA